ncbi:MAG: hypothetical protein A3F83_01185 [Candidatus Glassbacteria bacterium RIFCSPLOWO2_12_FULL_58_11]|uniref:histidine kinase n=1 Tax=Candidatus Glassbacteria bacterium RIFCSPLOWO2_12_FULL_58_11 TaxID=1817867 RepID=A0A1F5YYJ9_9BACT|nr:MAG: hypothetical protein A3F83_01185 [Candidatus Glassbacteria bacterium RIFCSPLOWO2_12_FULL_58_11]
MVSRRTEQLEETKKTLQQKSEELQIMLDASPAMIFYMDRDNRYVRVNKAFAELAGCPLRSIIGKTGRELFGENDSEFLVDVLQVIRTGKPILNHLETIKTKKGLRDLLVNKIPYRNIDGETIGIIGFALDVTERRRLEEEHSKASQLESLGLLAGGIAHDFNNILTAILGNISLGQTLVKKDEEIYRRLKEAESACLRAKDLTYQLLTFAVGGAPRKKATSLRDLIRDSTLFSLSGSNVRCEFTLPDNLWRAEVDENQISRVINNLVINANQAMSEGGTIQVRAENVIVRAQDALPLPSGKYLKISIIDHGHGISEENLPKIFDPFFTTKETGSGLGVTTAWSIVKRHSGHLGVKSSLGAGTTFDIYLPASDEPPQKREDAGRPGEAGQARVLVMDDETIVRNVAGKLLEHLGHRVEYASHGQEVIDRFLEAEKNGPPFDLVILDLTIPGGMGGKNTIEKLLEINPKIKAIVSSGYSNDPVLANFREYGFRGAVIKPYNIEEFGNVLNLVLAEKE